MPSPKPFGNGAATVAEARWRRGSGGSSSTRPATRAASRARCSACATAPKPPARTAAALSLPLELLTDRQREVLFLHYYADLDYATIAKALGISPGTVGATLSTARRVLRQALAPEVKS